MVTFPAYRTLSVILYGLVDNTIATESSFWYPSAFGSFESGIRGSCWLGLLGVITFLSPVAMLRMMLLSTIPIVAYMDSFLFGDLEYSDSFLVWFAIESL